ncbi:MAG: hypothetical protein HPY53_00200 [Brevinematales bacterium]|nr:hypothetical protein [Brevinematales bacterium]
MPRLALLFLVLFLAPIILFADKIEPGLNGKLGATAGSGSLDLSALNSRFSAYGYPALPEWYFTLGGIYQLSDGGIIAEFEYLRYINNSATGNGFIATAGGWCSWVNVGYALINLPFLQIYPIAGIGGGTLSVKVTEDFSVNGFDNILSQTNKIIELEKATYTAFIGGGVDFVIDMGPESQVDLLLGARAGYVFDLSGSSGWSSLGVSLPSGPSSGFSGPLIRVFIGIYE